MKALKGLLIYIGIILGSILGLCAILVFIMYFFPSVRIFGVSLVHYNTTVEPNPVILSDYSDYSDIELNVNSKKIHLSIVPAQVDNIECELNLNIFGFSTEIVEYTLVKDVKVEDDKLKIFLNVAEPNGWISTRASTAVIKVPASKEIALLTNSHSGNISVGASGSQLQLNSLYVSTNTGNLSLTNLSHDNETKTLELDSLNLNTDRGTFDLSDIENIKVLSKVKLSAVKGRFDFHNLEASLDVTGTGVELNAESIKSAEEGFKVIAKNAYFKINKLTSPIGAENTIITDNTSLKITEIVGKTGIVTEYGSVEIATLNDYSMIENTNGKVSISKVAKDTIIVKTKMGDINVAEYLKIGKFESEKGNITVNSTSEYVDGYYTEIINKDGKVTVTNNVNRLYVKTTGRSTGNIMFNKVVQHIEDPNKVFNHVIKVGDSSISSGFNVTLPTNENYYFKFWAKSGAHGELFGLHSGDGSNYYITSKEEVQYFPSDTIESIEKANKSAGFEFVGNITIIGNI